MGNQNSRPVIFQPGSGPIVICDQKPFDPALSTSEIKAALAAYTARKWFKSSVKAKDIELLNVQYKWAHVYQLHALKQKRRVEDKCCEFLAGSHRRLDDESLGPIPNMWDVPPRQMPDGCQRLKETRRMPHSEKIVTCDTCTGRGYRRIPVGSTDARGRTQTQTLRVTCAQCSGNGLLLSWKELTIEWVPAEYHYVATDSGVDKRRLLKANGHRIYDHIDSTVLPLRYLGDSPLCAEITEFAAKALSEHRRRLKKHQKGIWQRQSVTVVPIGECHYRYKNESVKVFYLFGKDRKGIYAPSFPLNACCSLM